MNFIFPQQWRGDLGMIFVGATILRAERVSLREDEGQKRGKRQSFVARLRRAEGLLVSMNIADYGTSLPELGLL